MKIERSRIVAPAGAEDEQRFQLLINEIAQIDTDSAARYQEWFDGLRRLPAWRSRQPDLMEMQDTITFIIDSYVEPPFTFRPHPRTEDLGYWPLTLFLGGNKQ